MNKLALILGLTTILAATGFLMFATKNTNTESFYAQEFAKFNSKFRKTHTSLVDASLRLEVFKSNYDLIAAHNAKSSSTYTLEINQFADLTFSEFKSYFLSEMPASFASAKSHCQEPQRRTTVSDSVNWNEKGKVQKVKNQGACGSCWAFSAVGAIESAIAIAKNEAPLDLSEQELVDCSGSYGNGGCQGGYMHWGFNYVLDNNIHLTSEYEYTASDDECKVPEIGQGKFEINGCVHATASVEGLVEALSVGPVSVAFAVQDDFRFYKDGVYNPQNCSEQINHGVLAFGFDGKAEVPYYFVKNSWGEGWGDKGLFKISYGTGKGTCAIAGNGYNFYPIA